MKEGWYASCSDTKVKEEYHEVKSKPQSKAIDPVANSQ